MNTVALRKVSGKCKQFPKLSTASWNVSDGNVSDGNVSDGMCQRGMCQWLRISRKGNL
jgi:hypothetical protein